MTLARLEWRSVGVPVLHVTELQKPRATLGRKIGIYTHKHTITATIVNITNVWKFQDYISFHIVSPNS